MTAMFLVAAMAAAATPGPDSAVGTWRTETKNGIVQVARCGGASLCGRLMTSDTLAADPGRTDSKNSDPSLRNRPIRGMMLMRGFTWNGSAWDGGSVYNPDDGRTYKGRITPVDANHLKLRGCVFVPLCKTQTWTRAK